MKDNKYKPGWKSVWAIYPKKNLIKNSWRPFLALVISVICSFCSSKSTTELISVVSNWITTGFPNIIGFILSGYILIVGFSGSDFLLKLAKPRKNRKYSLFQELNSTFAVVISIIIITYAVGAIVEFVVSCDIVWLFPTICGCNAFNYTVLILLEFMFFYAVNTLLDVIVNIFNMGQLANVIAENKLKALENSEKEENEQPLFTLLYKYIKSILGL